MCTVKFFSQTRYFFFLSVTTRPRNVWCRWCSKSAAASPLPVSSITTNLRMALRSPSPASLNAPVIELFLLSSVVRLRYNYVVSASKCVGCGHLKAHGAVCVYSYGVRNWSEFLCQLVRMCWDCQLAALFSVLFSWWWIPVESWIVFWYCLFTNIKHVFKGTAWISLFSLLLSLARRKLHREKKSYI